MPSPSKTLAIAATSRWPLVAVGAMSAALGLAGLWQLEGPDAAGVAEQALWALMTVAAALGAVPGAGVVARKLRGKPLRWPGAK